MKKAMSLLVSTLLVGSFASAGTVEENTESNKKSKFHNPITGTDTTTTKSKKSVKNPDGSSRDVNVKEKVKDYTDGTTERQVDVDDDSTTHQ